MLIRHEKKNKSGVVLVDISTCISGFKLDDFHYLLELSYSNLKIRGSKIWSESGSPGTS